MTEDDRGVVADDAAAVNEGGGGGGCDGMVTRGLFVTETVLCELRNDSIILTRSRPIVSRKTVIRLPIFVF